MFYEHNQRIHIRYYDKNDKYFDHGRMIYEGIPNKGDLITPFLGKDGPIVYTVRAVKFPEKDSCMEIYIEEEVCQQ